MGIKRTASSRQIDLGMQNQSFLNKNSEFFSGSLFLIATGLVNSPWWNSTKLQIWDTLVFRLILNTLKLPSIPRRKPFEVLYIILVPVYIKLNCFSLVSKFALCNARITSFVIEYLFCHGSISPLRPLLAKILAGSPHPRINWKT